MNIRDERSGDEPAVFAVNEAAFGRPDEAALVDALREAGAAVVSLVAENEDGEIVGHILFSEVTLEPPRPVVDVIGLAPVAVRPALQGGGIGSALIEEGLRRCAKLGYGAAVLLGHPAYYPRFGFLPAHRFGLRCEFSSEPRQGSAPHRSLASPPTAGPRENSSEPRQSSAPHRSLASPPTAGPRENPSPSEAFMALELAPGGLDGEPALVRYHPAFSAV